MKSKNLTISKIASTLLAGLVILSVNPLFARGDRGAQYVSAVERPNRPGNDINHNEHYTHGYEHGYEQGYQHGYNHGYYGEPRVEERAAGVDVNVGPVGAGVGVGVYETPVPEPVYVPPPAAGIEINYGN